MAGGYYVGSSGWGRIITVVAGGETVIIGIFSEYSVIFLMNVPFGFISVR